MTIKGTVVNGTVVLDEASGLPQGARVDVTWEAPKKAASPLGEMLFRHAGTVEGLPIDMAAQHDHYLHGTAER